MKPQNMCVLTLAGTDPSGGAGIQADIKTIHATGTYAASVITALVAQNTQGVSAIQPVPARFVSQQIDTVFSDLSIAAIKIGMLNQTAIIEVIASALEKYKHIPIVLDPVMIAKNGHPLLQPDRQISLKSLFSLATLITPNLFEASCILGQDIQSTAEMAQAAATLANTFKTNVLVKGGHLTAGRASDILHEWPSAKQTWFHAERINTRNTHGTGCTLSSAIASYLAQGHPLPFAIDNAKKYVSSAILAGCEMQIGQGFGPVDHFYFMREK